MKAGESYEEIAEKLPGRSMVAARERARAFGLALCEKKRWTEAEAATLRENFESGESWKGIAKGLPGRSVAAVENPGLIRLDAEALGRRRRRNSG
jgi:hypothetical protein